MDLTTAFLYTTKCTGFKALNLSYSCGHNNEFEEISYSVGQYVLTIYLKLLEIFHIEINK